MHINKITTREECEAVKQEVDRLLGHDPSPSSPEGIEINRLIDLIELFEFSNFMVVPILRNSEEQVDLTAIVAGIGAQA